MKPISIYALLVTCLIVKGYSELIQCYECDDCKELNDDLLLPCPPDLTTLPPSSDEESSSETSSSTDDSTTIAGDILANTEKANDTYGEEDHKTRNSRHLNYKTVSYQCFSIVKVGNESQQIRKGCIEFPANGKGCDVLKEVEGVSQENCKVCSQSKCNSSVGLKYSIVTVFMVSVMKAFF